MDISKELLVFLARSHYFGGIVMDKDDEKYIVPTRDFTYAFEVYIKEGKHILDYFSYFEFIKSEYKKQRGGELDTTDYHILQAIIEDDHFMIKDELIDYIESRKPNGA